MTRPGPDTGLFPRALAGWLLAASLAWLPGSGQAGTSHHHSAASSGPALAPGYGRLPQAPAAPGTYRLPVVRRAPDGDVIDDTGRVTTLHALFEGRLVVLNFMFTHCADPNGCPLASFVLRQLADHVASEPRLRGRVRIVSLSFDPARDTPARLTDYARTFRKEETDWHFVTTRDAGTLLPILAGYGQAVQRDPDGSSFSHQLRVFLIDPEGNIRNEYSTSYLHADTLRADLLTLGLPPPVAPIAPAAQVASAGDRREGYAARDFRSRTRAVAARTVAAVRTDLRALMRSPPLGLPPFPLPESALPSQAAIDLGRRLFFERRLSHNNTLACGSCHVPDQGFTQHELATPVGIEGRTVRRNAPSLYNVAYLPRLFLDSREYRLEQQVWSPLLARNEMANPAIGHVLEKLRATDDYAEAFARVYPGRGLTQETLGEALSAYQRGLLSGRSAFDRWRYGGDSSALDASARRGFELFTGRAGCSGCHRIGERDALFTDHELHNTGLGYARSMGHSVPGVVPVGPGITLAVAADAVAASTGPRENDLGYYEITGDPADRWKFRTPGLRNVALTAPYMHDGSLATLEEVIAFYQRGGIANEGLDPKIRPLALDPDDVSALLAFLVALTGDNVEALTRDAFSQPIGDIGRTTAGSLPRAAGGGTSPP